MWLRDKVFEAAWRRILREHPRAIDAFASGNEEMLARLRAQRPRLDATIRHFGLPPQSVVEEMVNGERTGSRKVSPRTPASMRFVQSEALTLEQMHQFFADGYVLCRAAVQTEIVDAALRHINSYIGRGSLDRSIPSLVGVTKEAAMAPAIIDLFDKSVLPSLVQSLLGVGKARPPFYGQVALRFPAPIVPKDVRAEVSRGRAWHVDGFEKGKHSPFTLLVGVCLSDVIDQFCGNLAVHCGAHWTLQERVKRAAVEGDGSFSITDREVESKPDLGPPLQLIMRRGDVVLAHQKLPHLGMSNYSPAIRYQVYFRIHHVELEQHRQAWLDDILLPFEGLRAAVSSV